MRRKLGGCWRCYNSTGNEFVWRAFPKGARSWPATCHCERSEAIYPESAHVTRGRLLRCARNDRSPASGFRSKHSGQRSRQKRGTEPHRRCVPITQNHLCANIQPSESGARNLYRCAPRRSPLRRCTGGGGSMRTGVRAIGWSIGAAALLALAGCDLGPDYHRPALDIPPAYRASAATAATAWPSADWWRGFARPTSTP